MNEGDFDEPRPCAGKLSRRLSIITDVVPAPGNGEDCVICLSAMDEECVATPCGHHFHQACLDQYLLVQSEQQEFDRRALRARCPVCRGSMRLPQAIEVSASSGLRIEVVPVPEIGGFCHNDRGYRFMSLGSFQRPGMFYVLTPNDDRRTPDFETMWTVEVAVPATVHLNFRSEAHVSETGAAAWLRSGGFKRNKGMKSTVSNGIPNGPYSGPVYSKKCQPGKVELKGSNTWEGVYFVFVEVEDWLPGSQWARQDSEASWPESVPSAAQEVIEAPTRPSRRLRLRRPSTGRPGWAGRPGWLIRERPAEPESFEETEAIFRSWLEDFARGEEFDVDTAVAHELDDHIEVINRSTLFPTLEVLAAEAEEETSPRQRRRMWYQEQAVEEQASPEPPAHTHQPLEFSEVIFNMPLPPPPPTPPTPPPPAPLPLPPPSHQQRPQGPSIVSQVPRVMTSHQIAPAALPMSPTPRAPAAPPVQAPAAPQRPSIQYYPTIATRIYNRGYPSSSGASVTASAPVLQGGNAGTSQPPRPSQRSRIFRRIR